MVVVDLPGDKRCRRANNGNIMSKARLSRPVMAGTRHCKTSPNENCTTANTKTYLDVRWAFWVFAALCNGRKAVSTTRQATRMDSIPWRNNLTPVTLPSHTSAGTQPYQGVARTLTSQLHEPRLSQPFPAGTRRGHDSPPSMGAEQGTELSAQP